jgi:hypothetical protein
VALQRRVRGAVRRASRITTMPSFGPLVRYTGELRAPLSFFEMGFSLNIATIRLSPLDTQLNRFRVSARGSPILPCPLKVG